MALGAFKAGSRVWNHSWGFKQEVRWWRTLGMALGGQEEPSEALELFLDFGTN